MLGPFPTGVPDFFMAEPESKPANASPPAGLLAAGLAPIPPSGDLIPGVEAEELAVCVAGPTETDWK